MTTAKDKGLAVTAKYNAAGDLGIGAEIDGVFVPLFTVPADRVAVLAAEAAQNADDNDDDGSKGGS